jgi:hypothetical protein
MSKTKTRYQMASSPSSHTAQPTLGHPFALTSGYNPRWRASSHVLPRDGHGGTSLFWHRASTVRHATSTIIDDFTAEPRSRRPPGYRPACLGRPLRLDFAHRVRSIWRTAIPDKSGLISLRRGDAGNNTGANNNGDPYQMLPGLFWRPAPLQQPHGSRL